MDSVMSKTVAVAVVPAVVRGRDFNSFGKIPSLFGRNVKFH